ncbi:amidase [Streptomyces hyaluromycini]|uniref:amidase n=1 Tax=Streptomyces hyaluromycini TaxID=1377993 RepID=UPI001FECEC14|nr:amidase family protein [Streptomyces hyaluromycini]
MRPDSGAGIAAARRCLLAGDLTVTQHIEATLTAIRERDTLGAFVAVAGDEALAAAEKADARIREMGADAWRDMPLLGVTVSVKDLLQTEDLPTRRGSMLRNDRVSLDVPVVARLRAAGAVVVGKTTTSEYGWSASTVSRVSAPTRNPYDPALTAGGSTGGGAAAVATGLCQASLGTDGAGSIRIPAAFCGVVGYKPSYGRLPYAPNSVDRLAHQGPLTRTVADAALLARVAAGPHLADPDSALGSLDRARDGRVLRVGWIHHDGTGAQITEVTDRARQALIALGHQVEPISVPYDDPYPALVDILAAAEAADTPPWAEQWCDPGRLEIVRYGRTLSGVTVIRAEEVRQALRVRLRGVMDRYDLLAMATVPVEPFRADAIAPDRAADPRDLQWLSWAPAAYPFNMTGQPVVTVPAGLTRSGLPAAVQLVGPVGADALVLAAAGRLESELGWLPRPPVASPSPGERTP